MTKRNERCPCGSNIKYKKCCMTKDKIPEKQHEVIGTLKKAFDIEDGDDFFARYIFGLGKMRDAIYSTDKRLSYDESFSPVFQNLLEAKLAREYAINLMNKHSDEIKEGKDGIIQGMQLNINNPIDNELNMFFKDFFIRGIIAIDCLIEHTKYMDYHISFLFSEDEKKIKNGIKKFPIPEDDERFLHLKNVVHDIRKNWYSQFREMRRQIEHYGYKLPDIKHKISEGRVEPIYPQINNQTIREILDINWENLSSFCEEIIVYIVSLKLPEYLMVVIIPKENRDSSMLTKYEIRHRDFPEARCSF